jgi:hypothetical protein
MRVQPFEAADRHAVVWRVDRKDIATKACSAAAPSLQVKRPAYRKGDSLASS